MKNGSIRDLQLATIIAEELEFILSSANDFRLRELRVTGVIPKAGGKHFIAYVAPEECSRDFGSALEMKIALKKATKFIRYELCDSLNLKRAPELTLMPDPLHSFR